MVLRSKQLPSLTEVESGHLDILIGVTEHF